MPRGKKTPLGDEEAIGGDAQGGMMMKAAPAPALIVIEPDFLFQFFVIALNAPSALGGGHQILERGVGRVVSQYWVGSASLSGHSIRSHSSGRSSARSSSRWAAGTRTLAKRERSGVLVPSRHVTLRHCDAGKDRARSLTGTGW